MSQPRESEQGILSDIGCGLLFLLLLVGLVALGWYAFHYFQEPSSQKKDPSNKHVARETRETPSTSATTGRKIDPFAALLKELARATTKEQVHEVVDKAHQLLTTEQLKKIHEKAQEVLKKLEEK